MEGVDDVLGEADWCFAWVRQRLELLVAGCTSVDSHLEKTCWVLEGAGFEEPEPMLLEVIENRTRYVVDREKVCNKYQAGELDDRLDQLVIQRMVLKVN